MKTGAAGFPIGLNGERTLVETSSPNTTLLNWLRAQKLTGTKEGCAEGDCGACTVLVIDQAPDGRRVFRTINSCIALMPTLAGKEIWTVEGLAQAGHHPVQKAMACGYGTQCGFCTPGFIASLAEGYYRDDIQTLDDLHAQLDGNLCRCTGYRPIREAALAAWTSASMEEKQADRLGSLLAQGTTEQPPSGLTFPEGSFLLPKNLSELWSFQDLHPEAVCLAGGTEVGVWVAKMHRRYPTYIGLQQVEEFLRLETNGDWMVLGAGLPLTDLMPAIREPFPSLYEMCRWFASRPIRNRATLGGNLATASPIGDTAPVLLSLGAELTLVSPNGTRTVPLSDFFTGYRKTILQPREWITEIRLPLPAAKTDRRVQSCKISKRREMDISMVSAGFCLELDANQTVVTARLAFGGVAATPVLSKNASALLVGKPLTAERIEAVALELEQEFHPITDVRATKEYRQQMPAELWRAFALREESPPMQRSLASVPITEPIGGIPHESASKHVSGSARYVDDDAERVGALHVWPVFSPHAHARLISLETTAASEVPGVWKVLTARDIPALNNTGAVRHDEPLLAGEKVEFVGQTVAAVVGESLDACRKAAALVKATYETLPAITSLPEAIAENSFHTEFNTIQRGDASAALARAPHRFSGEFSFGGQEHFYLEGQAAFAEITEDDLLLVHSSTQHPSESQAIIGHVLGCDRNRVIVHSPRMGGGFGGKETQGAGPAALAALATHLTRQACRVRFNRDQDIVTTGKRHPFLAKFEVGTDAEGRVLALTVDLFANGGWSLDLSQPICDRALFHLDNIYYLPEVTFRGRVAKTNLPSNTAFRGFGGPQGMLVIEEIVDRIARQLGLDPHAVREKNLYHGSGETNTTHYGQEIGDNRLVRIWHDLKDQARYEERRAELRAWNMTSSRFKRGLAQTGVKFGISFTHTPYNQAGALVLIYTDGSVQVNHGGTEMGQGLYTKIQSVAAQELGLPISAIRVTQTRTDKIPNTSATAASSGSDLNGAATRNACVQIRERLLPVARQMLAKKFGGPVAGEVTFSEGDVWSTDHPGQRVTFAEVVLEAYTQRIALAAFGYYKTPDIHYDRAKGRGMPFYYFACGSAVSEVEIDVRTGRSRLVRVDILHDVGNSLNPSIDRGQIEGGFIQGMGWLTSEEVVWNREGHLLSHGASTYEIPTIGDTPLEFHVRLLPDAAQPGTIHGSKAVGEPPLMLAISVREAIRDAIAAAGLKGEIALSSPATCEAIYRALKRMPPTEDAHNRLTV